MGFKAVLGKAFPFISAAMSIGGAPGTMAASLLGKAFGLDKVEPTSEALNNILATSPDPEIMLKMRQAEDEFQLKMKELGITEVETLLSMDNEDRVSAREREKTVKDYTPRIIAYVVIAMTFILEALVIFHGVPSSVDGVVLGRVLGTLDSATTLVLAYYFGSSSGSHAKDAIIADHMADQDLHAAGK